jgi:hypothetical protein
MYELNSERAASWLRQDAPALEFITNFGRAAVLKSKPFVIIAEFVLVGFDPTNMGDLLTIEEANELSMGAVKSVKWIKPIQRREVKQQTAHLIVNFTSVQDANCILQRGILIAGTRVKTRKLLQDPQRCFKCHQHGVDHLVTNCPQVHDVYGTCTGRHHTSECLKTNPKFYKCVNCRVDGNGAWSRDCPSFIQHNERFQVRFPEHKYKFFPISSDPTTWERLDRSTEGSGDLNHNRCQAVGEEAWPGLGSTHPGIPSRPSTQMRSQQRVNLDMQERDVDGVNPTPHVFDE